MAGEVLGAACPAGWLAGRRTPRRVLPPPGPRCARGLLTAPIPATPDPCRLEQEKRKLKGKDRLDKAGGGAASHASRPRVDRSNLHVRRGRGRLWTELGGCGRGQTHAAGVSCAAAVAACQLRGGPAAQPQPAAALAAGLPRPHTLPAVDPTPPLAPPLTSPAPQNIRVVQPNLVYAVGLSLDICHEEALRDAAYFGQYGRTLKISVNRQAQYGSALARHGPTGSAYITYKRPEGARRLGAAVLAVVVVERCRHPITARCGAHLPRPPAAPCPPQTRCAASRRWTARCGRASRSRRALALQSTAMLSSKACPATTPTASTSMTLVRLA